MARPANPGFTPSHRGPALGDERPSTRERDPVLTTVGWKTSDIRLTAAGTDISAGEGAIYNFGVCDKDSVGDYLFRAQSAASATADPLGAVEFVQLTVREQSAGVFKADIVLDFDGLIAAEDATQRRTNITAADIRSDSDTPVFTTTDGDGDLTFSVATSTTAATLEGLTWNDKKGGAVEENCLVMVEVRAAATEVWSVERLS